MKVHQTPTRFLARVQSAGYNRTELTPDVGLDLFFDFFEEEEADGCERDGMGDRLEFQYGTFAGSGGAYFEVLAVREMVLSDTDEDTDGAYRLSLSFRFPPAAGAGLGGELMVCEFEDELPGYRRDVMNTPAVAAVGRMVAQSVNVHFEKVMY